MLRHDHLNLAVNFGYSFDSETRLRHSRISLHRSHLQKSILSLIKLSKYPSFLNRNWIILLITASLRSFRRVGVVVARRYWSHLSYWRRINLHLYLETVLGNLLQTIGTIQIDSKLELPWQQVRLSWGLPRHRRRNHHHKAIQIFAGQSINTRNK